MVDRPSYDGEPYFHCEECGNAGFIDSGELCPACMQSRQLEDLEEDEAQHCSPCTMGVGCDEAGVCYAAAHGQPDQCPKKSDASLHTASSKTGAGMESR